MLIHWIAPPLIGAVIGYITNYIAIKMLFRPLTPKMIFGRRLPFTPGIIPRRKAQLADALGKAVFAKFFNWDDLEIVFLSEPFAEKIACQVAAELRSTRTMGELEPAVPEAAAARMRAALATRIRDRLVASGTARKMVISSAQAMSESETGRLMGNLATAYAGPIADQLASEGQTLIAEMLAEEGTSLAEEPVGRLTEVLFENERVLIDGIKAVYLRFMRKNVRPIVESIDIVTQITGKMNLMSAGEVESLVLDIVARELRMVVWFGALLGAVIGTVNIFL
ncbi:hypothetical protein HMP0721_2471 [Pseudoramibacter alactolyticus ATCC 23263]|uniref:DUF445 domain-containing protein n=1 Tax=Pseudoramibacter alactolyticus ATCC 23263 TaxID=887929 RepID=E6MKD5_9FIRM|nr:DUF445 family protein [Pseudoramibacter alactolyticus]EFV00472.1 hypothetical protein HMP0721_2471 [Pseudoramibacter alactolyticus ATCC 23263]